METVRDNFLMLADWNRLSFAVEWLAVLRLAARAAVVAGVQPVCFDDHSLFESFLSKPLPVSKGERLASLVRPWGRGVLKPVHEKIHRQAESLRQIIPSPERCPKERFP